MSERIEPVVRIPVDPARVVVLGDDHPTRGFGGRRVKTTIYVVEQPDLSSVQEVTTITVPMGRTVELQLREER